MTFDAGSPCKRGRTALTSGGPFDPKQLGLGYLMTSFGGLLDGEIARLGPLKYLSISAGVRAAIVGIDLGGAACHGNG